MNDLAETESAAIIRDSVLRMEAELLKLPQVELKIRHFFADGVYAREMTVPKGVAVCGRIHLQSQINIVSRGDFLVTTDNGPVRVGPGFTVVSPPGTKRAGYALEETVWTTILGTELTDPEVIYETLTAASFDELEFKQHPAIGETTCHLA